MTPWLHYAPAAGWMNDPNGLVYGGGRHHMYYQFNPAGTAFGNQHWGHASSADLLTWTEHAVALTPGPEAYDATACFSGCAVERADGSVSFVYTGVAEGVTLPCLAHATGAGLTVLRKDPANPLIAAVPGGDVTDFRDHTVWYAGDRWWQLIAGARADRGGTLFAYSSADLRSWTYHGVYADHAGTGVPGAIWECPDRLRLAGGDALVVSVIYQDLPAGRPEVWWITGTPSGDRSDMPHFDMPHFDVARFDVARFGPCDVGDRFYAPQSYSVPDGRRIQFGWVRTHLDPACPAGPTVGVMSLPRELSIRDGRLHVVPAAELRMLRRAIMPLVDGPLDSPQVAGELVLEGPAAAATDRVVLRSANGGEMTVDLSAFAARGGELRLFWDVGIVEVFRDGLAGIWTDLRLESVIEVRLHRRAAAAGRADVWQLDRAARTN